MNENSPHDNLIENNNPPEAPEFSKTDAPAEKEKPDMEILKDKINDLEIAGIEKKIQTLKEVEERVDKKINQLKEIVAETRTEGKGFSGITKKEETPEEYSQRVLRGEI